MTIERRDNRLQTAIKERSPLRLFRGDRTWSTMKDGEYVILEDYKVPLQPYGTRTVVIKAKDDSDTILHAQIAVTPFGTVSTHKAISHSAINETGAPWSDLVRYSPVEE